MDENSRIGQGFLLDVSKSGLQIETERKLSKGITLALNAPEEEELERTSPFMARVKWTRAQEDGKYRAGLALPKEVEDDPHWLESLLSHFGNAPEQS